MTPRIFDLSGKRVFIAGHRGMVGSALMRRFFNIRCDVLTATRQELDLSSGGDVRTFLATNKPDVVIIAAGKVGGIHANSTFPADFIRENLAIALNLIGGSHEAGVSKLLYLGSSCIYPSPTHQPIAEEQLLSGPLEPTNEWYALAKISGVKLCQAYRRQHKSDFISAMPTNLYGQGDNYHPENSHVIAGMMRRFHEAKLANAPETTIWGSGKPRREFMFVDDLADACVFLLESYSGDQPINVGTGQDVSVSEVAKLVADVVGYRGNLSYDPSRPDGSPRKLLDVSKLTQMGWSAKTTLPAGLQIMYNGFLAGHRRSKH